MFAESVSFSAGIVIVLVNIEVTVLGTWELGRGVEDMEAAH